MKNPTVNEINHFLSETYRNEDSPSHIQSEYWSSFVSDIKKLESERKLDQENDFKFLQKMKGMGRLATILGYATGWIFPNPLSAFLMAMGNYTRWANVYHPISHGAYDHMENISSRYKSKNFAKGTRRLVDWLDWIEPKNWDIEHNTLHHYYLGTDEDPDIVSRNTQMIRDLNIPLGGKLLFIVLLASTWKFSYYAPNTLIEQRNFNNKSQTTKISLGLFNPFLRKGREIWLRSIFPYFGFKFLLVPALFLFMSEAAAINIFLTTVFAEIIANIYSFCTIATNHTGDDVVVFEGRPVNKADFYLRQIIGSVNFPSQNDFHDFLYGGMNYQIEHHIWPQASVYQCRRLRPKLIKICEKYGIPYREEPIIRRIGKLVDAIVHAKGGEIEVSNLRGESQC